MPILQLLSAISTESTPTPDFCKHVPIIETFNISYLLYSYFCKDVLILDLLCQKSPTKNFSNFPRNTWKFSFERVFSILVATFNQTSPGCWGFASGWLSAYSFLILDCFLVFLVCLGVFFGVLFGLFFVFLRQKNIAILN